MSKVGKAPIDIPEGIELSLDDGTVTAKNEDGLEFTQEYDRGFVTAEIDNDQLVMKRKANRKEYKEKHGLYRSLVANMLEGLVEPFEKNLVLEGLGYRVREQGNDLVFELGYSHPIEYPLPENIDAEVEDNDQLTIKGPDKQEVGQVAADIKSLRPPEPYKGKGIKYKGEEIIRKEGKLSGGEEAEIG
ncbi:50S ribosomal protein L6 [Candidatus Bipolaricaulota bacterium]|nr:50S ribosomal protein L6 [Candidatus Bipolaricaulota bacterium]